MDKYRKTAIEYWSEENILQKRKAYFDYVSRKMFARLLPELKNKMILDVGCGLGMTMDYFIAQKNHVYGIDITSQSVSENKKRGLETLEADARYLPFRDNLFDLVYSLGVIEHFAETELALQEKVRVCKPGGVIVAVVPYLYTPYYLGGILFERLTRPKYDFRTTYGKVFSKRKFKEMLEKVGCENAQVYLYYGCPFLRVMFNKVHSGLVDFIENSFLSTKFGLVIFGMGYKRE